MQTKSLFLLLFLLTMSPLIAVLPSCSVYPETFDERLASAYITNTSVRSTAAAAIRADKISPDQGRNVLRLTDQVRDVLDVSADGDERGLDLAIEILERLQRYFE